MRNGLTGKHALIDNAVTAQQQAITGKLGQVRIADLIDITGHKFA